MKGEIFKGRVSFVVPTRNSARTLERCLQSLREQTWCDVEIVVVDNRSSDDTALIALELADIFASLGPERSAQRNHGAELSSGEVLVFIDSDMRAEPELAAEALTLLEAAPVAAAVIPELSFGYNFWASCKALEKLLYLGDSSVEAARIFRRSSFLAAGGYDVRITGGEDWDLPDRLQSQGLGVGRTETPIWHDEGAPSLRQLFRKKRQYSGGLTTLARRAPRSTFEHLFRMSILRKPHLLREHPASAAGLVIVKTVEGAAVLSGLLQRRPFASPPHTPALGPDSPTNAFDER